MPARRRSPSKESCRISSAGFPRSRRGRHFSAAPSILSGPKNWQPELRPVFKRILRLVDLPLEAVYDARFLDSTRRFLQAARDFDPGLSIASAYQALRNVWIMNSLQFDLGLPVEHTDAVFAYSMVYPYLDNVLDDASTSETEKLALAGQAQGLARGRRPRLRTRRERRNSLSLVELIERRYASPDFPGVYRSLLAIYNAQVKSLLQQRPGSAFSPDDILAISLEKGGTSVLADGYLVAGGLEPADEEFCFGFGTFLQLADDLQDIAEDSRGGHRTLFSAADGRAPLDRRRLELERYLAAVRGKGQAGRDAEPVRPLRRDRERPVADVPGIRGKTPGIFPPAVRPALEAGLPRPLLLSGR